MNTRLQIARSPIILPFPADSCSRLGRTDDARLPIPDLRSINPWTQIGMPVPYIALPEECGP